MSKHFVRPPICTRCGGEALSHHGRHGVKHFCCGLASWNGKPLVHPRVLRARRLFHDAFDRLWRGGERGMRQAAYMLLAQRLGMPEKDCHGATQTDIKTLRRMTDEAARMRRSDVHKFMETMQEDAT